VLPVFEFLMPLRASEEETKGLIQRILRRELSSFL
jgi:hypothetical protein